MDQVTITVPSYEQEKSASFNIKFYLRFVFHLVAVATFWSVGGYAGYISFLLFTTDDDISEDSYVQNIKWLTPCYLTNWNFFFQTCFLTMAVLYDLLAWIDRHETRFGMRLKYYTDLLFSGLVVPLTMFISSMFWCVYWIDRELVFPKVYDQIVPWWFNHCVHTNIVVVILLETVLQARRHPANLKIELWLNGIVGVAYAIVYYSIFFFANRWLYGVHAIMTWWQVCLYQTFNWAITFVYYGLQFPVNRLFHKAEDTEEKTFEKKTESSGLSSDSWNLKFRSKGLTENSHL